MYYICSSPKGAQSGTSEREPASGPASAYAAGSLPACISKTGKKIGVVM